ncbi:MAG: DUF192 domain-containing protein [Rhodospirillaceae bacterium]|nr:DUF192 domain-containing protein [Rhodospirillaceae bacterium]
MKGFGFRFALVFAAVFAVLFMFVWFYLSVVSQAEAATIERGQQVDFIPAKIEIKSSGEIHCFNGELALSPEQHSIGLMFRKEIPADYAMVFDFGHLRPGAMWMKNTFVSLDMLFADENRQITFIAANTTPQSEDIVTSPEPVRYVLEVPGGTAKRLGINVGDSFSLRNEKY